MGPDESAVTSAYLEHLTAQDVSLLLAGAGRPEHARDRRELLRLPPGELQALLSRHSVFRNVFGPDAAAFGGTSPFLAFAVAVHRAGAELGSATHVPEWLAPGRRAPVFDVAQLRDFMSVPWRPLFLAELLTSYTRVASGSVLVSTRRGWRRLRFSELDPVRLAGLLDAAADTERPGILRRLGDLALFLTGVFPDYVARHGFSPLEEGRLLRAGGGRTSQRGAGASEVPAADSAVGLLEQLGRRWYRAAFDLLPRPVAGNVEVIGELPERFGQARRILGLVTERFIFPHRDRWFGVGGG
jgi:hypothetical protein